MNLICPKCKSTRIVYTGISGISGLSYGSLDQRFTCKECGYTGPLVIDLEKKKRIGRDRYRKFPFSWVLILAMISVSAIAIGESIETAFLFFIILSLVLIIFFYFIRQDEFRALENDFKNLDEDGLPKH